MDCYCGRVADQIDLCSYEPFEIGGDGGRPWERPGLRSPSPLSSRSLRS